MAMLAIEEKVIRVIPRTENKLEGHLTKSTGSTMNWQANKSCRIQRNGVRSGRFLWTCKIETTGLHLVNNTISSMTQ